MNADEARQATAAGGPLEFVHAGGRIIVPVETPSVEGQLRGAIFTAVVHGRPTLFDGPEGREAVLISRARYAELVAASKAYGACMTAAAAAQADAAGRLVTLERSHGCEAAAEKARMEGQAETAERIMSAAAGIEEQP